MPYIDKDVRVLLDNGFAFPQTAGELNYLFTTYIIRYIKDKGESYQTYNDILGVLSAVPKELYDRRIRAYEDKKIQEHGDLDW